MKNFNDMYLNSKKEKALEKDIQKSMMVERLAGNLKKFMCNSDFMKEAESLLSDKGYFKIPLTAVFADGQIYTAIENERQTENYFWRHEAPHILDSSSQSLQEKIKKDFTDFWAERGVQILFVYENAVFVVESLLKNSKRQFLDDHPKINRKYYNSIPCDLPYVLYQTSTTIDITKYIPGPFCYIK